MRRLVSWFLDKFDQEVTAYLINEKVFKRNAPRGNGGPPDAAAIRAARANIRYHLRYIGYLTARRNCLAGRAMTSADLAAAAHLSCIDYLGEVPWAEDMMAKQWYAASSRARASASCSPTRSAATRRRPTTPTWTSSGERDARRTRRAPPSRSFPRTREPRLCRAHPELKKRGHEGLLCKRRGLQKLDSARAGNERR